VLDDHLVPPVRRRSLVSLARDWRCLQPQGHFDVVPDAAATPSPSQLIAHMEQVTESERLRLARTLHDDLGGKLVAALMDLAWLERQLGTLPDTVKSRLVRMRAVLGAAVDWERQLIEHLRPTLLDNVGFIAALRWYAHKICDPAAIRCTLQTPEEEPCFSAPTATSLYRISQEVLDTLLKDQSVATLSIRVSVNGDRVSLEINSDGLLRGDELMQLTVSRLEHRMAVLGGHGEFRHAATPGTTFVAELCAVPVP
jgi:signal transduction histidine kinase